MKFSTNRLNIAPADQTVVTNVSRLNGDGIAAMDYLSGLSESKKSSILRDTDYLIQILLNLVERFIPSDGYEKEFCGAWKKDGILVGYIGIIGASSPTPELVLEIIPEYQNCGYGAELLGTFLNELRNRDGFQYTTATILPENTACIRLVEKFGGVLQIPNHEIEPLLFKRYCIQ